MFLEKIDFATISFLGDDLYDPLLSCSVFKDGNKFTQKKLAGSFVQGRGSTFENMTHMVPSYPCCVIGTQCVYFKLGLGFTWGC